MPYSLYLNITHAVHGVDDVLHGALAELVHARPLEIPEALPDDEGRFIYLLITLTNMKEVVG